MEKGSLRAGRGEQGDETKGRGPQGKVLEIYPLSEEYAVEYHLDGLRFAGDGSFALKDGI